jgi:general secretion pathway protein A
MPEDSWYEDRVRPIGNSLPATGSGMYCEHFGLKENPFSIAPDPRYLYLSEAHREAMAHLLFALRGEGCFVLLTGEVGTGKTLVCRCLLEQLPDQVQVALVLNPCLSVDELLATICDELGIAYPEGSRGSKVYVDRLNRFLLDAHGRGLTTVLIIDEAQNLSSEVLEQLRLLTNLETGSRKLLQIILIGQPELRTLLQRQDLRQLAQRITARYHLGPLEQRDLGAYLSQRLGVAGVRRPLFSAAALRRLYRLSGGIPRLINILSDRALLGAYARGRHRVDATLVAAAAREVEIPRPRRAVAAGLTAFALLLAACGWWWFQSPQPAAVPPPNSVESPARAAAVATEKGGEEHPAEEAAGKVDASAAESMPVEAAAAATGVPAAANQDWFADIDPNADDPAAAWTVLLHLWGDPLPVPDQPCSFPQQSGFACFTSSATLDTLRALDRPAILKLRRPDGHPFYAVLAGMDGDRVILALDDRVGLLPAEQLQNAWLGSFTLLWQPPADVQATLKPGDKGPAVAWLAAGLDLADGIAGKEPPAQRFGPGLADRVKQFQLRHGVHPDGIVGPQTLILLTNALAASGPRLGDLFAEH